MTFNASLRLPIRRIALIFLILLAVVALSQPANADQQGEALLAETKAAYLKFKTYEAVCRKEMKTPGREPYLYYQADIKLKKANFASIGITIGGQGSYKSDGRYLYHFTPGKQYEKTPVSTFTIASSADVATALFFGPETAAIWSDLDYEATKTIQKEVTLNGTQHFVLLLTHKKPSTSHNWLYIDKSTHLITKIVMESDTNGGHYVDTETFSDIKTNAPMSDADFAVEIPKGYTELKTLKPANDPYSAKLLPVGKMAPRFSMPDRGGGNIALASALRGKKAVLVNFWYYG